MDHNENLQKIAETRRCENSTTHVICKEHGILSVDQCYKTRSIHRKDGYRYHCKICRKVYNNLIHLVTRLEILEKYYGKICSNCHIEQIEFLCLDHINDDGGRFRNFHKENVYRFIKKNGFLNGVQTLCNNCNAVKQLRKNAEQNLDNAKAIQTRIYRSRVKSETINNYGVVCDCCGESDVEKLTIDHINGGGNLERKHINITGGFWFYKYLRDNSCPPGYRVLCFNCNISIGHYNYCPHHNRPELITGLLYSTQRHNDIKKYHGHCSVITECSSGDQMLPQERVSDFQEIDQYITK